jgi:hypothetical protein
VTHWDQSLKWLAGGREIDLSCLLAPQFSLRGKACIFYLDERQRKVIGEEKEMGTRSIAFTFTFNIQACIHKPSVPLPLFLSRRPASIPSTAQILFTPTAYTDIPLHPRIAPVAFDFTSASSLPPPLTPPSNPLPMRPILQMHLKPLHHTTLQRRVHFARTVITPNPRQPHHFHGSFRGSPRGSRSFYKLLNFRQVHARGGRFFRP